MNCPTAGSRETSPERFVLFRPDAGATPIQPGETMIIRSEQTGKYCRAAQIGAQQQIMCDQDTPATATPLTYTSTSFEFNGQPFVNPGSGVPCFFGLASTSPTPATWPLAPVPTSTLLQIEMPGKGLLRVDNLTSHLTAGSGDGSSTSEHFYLKDPTNPTATTTKLVESGQSALLVSAATGKYCRVAPYP
jgi:hypothetical protein